jgi:hypothetical protein
LIASFGSRWKRRRLATAGAVTLGLVFGGYGLRVCQEGNPTSALERWCIAHPLQASGHVYCDMTGFRVGGSVRRWRMEINRGEGDSLREVMRREERGGSPGDGIGGSDNTGGFFGGYGLHVWESWRANI